MMFSDDSEKHETDQPGPSELRWRAPRSTLLLLVARIVGEGHDTLCRLSNISTGGLRADGPAGAFTIGEQVTVEVRNAHRLSGEVRWARDGAFGIRFDRELDVADFLAAIASMRSDRDGERARPPRMPTCCGVEVRTAGRIHRAVMLDISQAGARLAFDQPVLDPALLLTIAIPGLPMRQAAVRWSHDAHYGLAFLETFGLAQLSEWLVDTATRYAAVAR
ncbi:MAG TPA: PilZ domain-containing protein [Sphingobium sp.]|uniref:PilZ domain-containing protein n=1 Tax=Sphingobium sp. TaxID=1912891 RepID=UPI002ED4A3FE